MMATMNQMSNNNNMNPMMMNQGGIGMGMMGNPMMNQGMGMGGIAGPPGMMGGMGGMGMMQGGQMGMGNAWRNLVCLYTVNGGKRCG